MRRERAPAPRRADASGLSPRPQRRGRRHGRWAEARVRSGRCAQRASCCAHGRRGLRAEPEQESSPAARTDFRQLRSPALLTVVCAVSQRRTAATPGRPGKPSPSVDAGSERSPLGRGLGDPPPASALPARHRPSPACPPGPAPPLPTRRGAARAALLPGPRLWLLPAPDGTLGSPVCKRTQALQVRLPTHYLELSGRETQVNFPSSLIPRCGRLFRRCCFLALV